MLFPYPRTDPALYGELSGQWTEVSRSTAPSHCCQPSIARETPGEHDQACAPDVSEYQRHHRITSTVLGGSEDNRPEVDHVVPREGFMDMAMGAGIIWPVRRRCPNAVGAPRRVAIVGAAVLAVAALAAVPDANAVPPQGCFPGPGPQPVPGCAVRAYEADIAAGGFRDARGNTVAVDQGLDICTLMDRGLSRPDMESQFLRDNPGLGPNGTTQVVGFAISDLCPWHS